MGTVIHKTSGSCMGEFGDLRSQSSAGFLGAYQRGISVWGCSPKAVPLVMGGCPQQGRLLLGEEQTCRRRGRGVRCSPICGVRQDKLAKFRR